LSLFEFYWESPVRRRDIVRGPGRAVEATLDLISGSPAAPAAEPGASLDRAA